jgi:hypothetical protein
MLNFLITACVYPPQEAPTMHTSYRSSTFVIPALLALLLTSSVANAQAPAPAKPASPSVQPAGPEIAQFTLSKTPEPLAWQETGSARPFILIPKGGLTLTTQAPIKPGTRITGLLKCPLIGKEQSSLRLDLGLKAGDTPGLGPLSFSLYTPANTASYWIYGVSPGILNPKEKNIQGYWYAKHFPENRLAWPQLTRDKVEADFASLPDTQEKWLTVQADILPKGWRIWIDNQLIAQGEGNPEGFARLRVEKNCQLASLTLASLPLEQTHFMPVALDTHLNANTLNGAKVKPLPPAAVPGTGTVVAGVPFEIPTPSLSGNTHVDVGASWLRAGLVEGVIAPYDGQPTQRWAGVFDYDPARLQFSVPKGDYCALHLLAIAQDQPDTLKGLAVQFFRPLAGHPLAVWADVPDKSEASSLPGIPVQLANGKAGRLVKVTIPLTQGELDSFADDKTLNFELTKKIHVYRNFPDPAYYSMHAAGLPSGVQVFGATFQRADIGVELTPERVGHTWTFPDKPVYLVKLTNTTNQPQTVTLGFATTSYDQQEKRRTDRIVALAPGEEKTQRVELIVNRYGNHDVVFTIKDQQGVRTKNRSLALLRTDDRKRGDYKMGDGMRFGFWDWAGGHGTLAGVPRLQLLYDVGSESSMRSFADLPKNEMEFCEKHKMSSSTLTTHFSMQKHYLGVEFDPTKPQEMGKLLVDYFKKQPSAVKSAVSSPDYATMFAEPILGPVSYMSLPEYYNEPAYEMTEQEKKTFKAMEAQFLSAAPAIKKEWPNIKLYMPWGLANFTIAFLRHSPKATELMDGPAIDMAPFERMPEMQIEQVTLQNEMWQTKQEWLKHSKKPWPDLVTVEGPCVTQAHPGALTQRQEAAHSVRSMLTLAAYNVHQPLGWPVVSQCGGMWGESHYGSGLTTPLPIMEPKTALGSHAAMTRNLNRMRFDKARDTGSTTVFCLDFKRTYDGKEMSSLWTIRGKRPVTFTGLTGPIQCYDAMDNLTEIAPQNGQATITIDDLPCYVWGLPASAKIQLGEPDHSDAKPGPVNKVLGNLGKDGWKFVEARETDYENSRPEFTRRFHGPMSAAAVSAPESAGKKALQLHLDPQPVDRKVMPYYRMLKPNKPVAIPGTPSHLGLWVNASSDWGRVVYTLRDAKGEKWISSGTKDQWNCDDVHCWSRFNFDGWRYLKFELPSNAPYDLYRKAGSVWWGSYEGPNEGRGIVDYPLTLENIIVERRNHVVYVNELVNANPADVALGDIVAEYESSADAGKEAIRISKIRMPVPQTSAALSNPITEMANTNKLPATQITRVQSPEREYDGTRCLVYFEPSPQAVTYDIWATTHADGKGAIKLGTGWTKPGTLLTGLTPDTDYYLSITYTDKDKNVSKPSQPLKVNLRDMFPLK